MPFLKKISSSVLLLIYLFSATAIGELFKLPVLIGHYYDHREENRSTNLVAFFIMHYQTEDGTDKDAKEDSQLPFKSMEHAATVAFVSLTPPSFINITAKPERPILRSFGVYKELFLSSQYLVAIWQPPRYC
ncbi:hypothetical protein [Ferruginibacter sp.]|nr:hypothetical protein [Ferruginibacter sp.]